MNIFLIRHAKTIGNIEKRYIGITDESLSKEASINLEKYPVKMNLIYSSPLKRCIETAKIFFPLEEIFVVNDLKECDFGDFENKNYEELKNIQAYQDWISGKIDPPNGEKQVDFKKRCCKAFIDIINNSFAKNYENIAIITHGGTIMAIMEKFALPKKQFYDWQPKNTQGFILNAEKMLWQESKKVSFIKIFK